MKIKSIRCRIEYIAIEQDVVVVVNEFRDALLQDVDGSWHPYVDVEDVPVDKPNKTYTQVNRLQQSHPNYNAAYSTI